MDDAEIRRWTGPFVTRAGLRSQWHVLLLGAAFLSPLLFAAGGTDLVGYLATALMVPVGLLCFASVLVPRYRPEVVIDDTHLTVRGLGRKRRMPLVDIALVRPQHLHYSTVVRVENRERQELSRRRWWFTAQGVVTVPDVFGLRPEEIAEEIKARAAAAQQGNGLS
jgi:hypothetical protein